jgi:putative SOS response-associated peptidase YedK
MCNFKSLAEKKAESLADYYSADYDKILEEIYGARFVENAFDHFATPILTVENPKKLIHHNWGLIPWFSKTLQDGLALRPRTVNCRSEEMYITSSFRDAAKKNQRCLIPATGFFESKWLDVNKKTTPKFPFLIYKKEQPIFSFAGLYSKWTDKSTDTDYLTYTILTTAATGNKLMSDIHNSKLRMPVILPKEYEKDWLNPNLTEDDVKALCQPYSDSGFDAYPVSKLIYAKKETERNVPAVLEKATYQELNQNLSLF